MTTPNLFALGMPVSQTAITGAAQRREQLNNEVENNRNLLETAQDQDTAVSLQIADGSIDTTTGTGTVNTTTNTTTNTTESGTTADIDALIAQRDQLQTLIDTLTKEANDLQNKIDQETQELEELNKEYENELDELQDMQAEFENKQNKLADVNDEILAAQMAEQRAFEGKIGDVTDAAINDYNPEEHGDSFEAYLDKQLGGVGFNSYALDSLNSDAKKLAGETNDLLGQIKSQAALVRNLSAQITDKKDIISKLQSQLDIKNTEINTNTTQLETVKTEIGKINGAGLSGTEVLAQLSDAEKQLVKDNNIDLTETYEDGSPRYVVARGQDDKYHIYEMDQSGTRGTSLARQFGTQGNGLRGSDIVPSGSGYMNGVSDAADNAGRAVYSFSSVSEDLTSGEACSKQKCYTTSSPLSFDIDGDGVNTSSKTVRFDIDGDGKLDTVNDSAEWVLAFDKDKDGIAGENGSELFGDNTDLDGDGKKDGYANGFDALKALAEKEGLVGPEGGVLTADNLKFLEEKYGLVMTKGYGGEAKSLSDLGVTEINLSKSDETKLTKNFDGRHNDIMTQEGATFKVNGQTREYADIWNAQLDKPVYKSTADSKDVKAEPNKIASSLSFDINSIDLDKSLEFLQKADASTEVRAIQREVDYGSAILEGKTSAKLEQSIKETTAEIKEKVVEKAEDEDDDFINFQKKKIR